MAARKDASREGPRRRLGRGLTSLMSTAVPLTEPPPPQATSEPPGEDRPPGDIRLLPAADVHPNRVQPRQHFDDESLEALAASIRTAGLMQPVVVRPDRQGGFELIVGERRWRAARKLGLDRLPAIVREVDDQAAAEWALIENIQREDLNPLERADAFRHLTEAFGLTHQEVAERVGLERSTVTNLLRLHDLDEVTAEAVRAGHLSLAHARALLSVADVEARRQLARQAVREGWSVRALERRAASVAGGRRRGPAPAPRASAGPVHRQDLERRLSEHLGTRVSIKAGKRKGSGRLTIEFYSFEQFEGLMERLDFDAGV